MLGCEPRNFLQPCLLLLLREQPAHGYELVERLRPLAAVDGNAGRVYRVLRALEEEQLVCSDWSASDAGPRKRTYRLTAAGERLLDDWAERLEYSRRALDAYLTRHARTTTLPHPRPVAPRPTAGLVRSGAPARR